MRSRTLEAYKATLKLTQRQHEVLVGLLLGDGHIEQPYTTPRARLKVEQRVAMKAYVEWLYEIFQDWVRSDIASKNHSLKATGKSYKSLGFTTFAHEKIMPYRQLFYPAGKKVIPGNLIDLLTPLGLTVWFMDDGSVKSHESKGRILNTHSFTQNEVEHLCSILQEKFELMAHPRQQTDGVQIYISGKSANTLQALLEPHIIPEMEYKLPWYGHSR
tara:strand:+ start:366 stop:1013 length:648 start_codon:yes stop_codon:yes gene_type:complete